MWNFQIKYEKSLYEFTYESLSRSFCPCRTRSFLFVFHLIKQQHQFCPASPLLMLCLCFLHSLAAHFSSSSISEILY